MKKRRVNIILKNFNKKNSFFDIIKPTIDISITLILKTFNLRLIITSYKTIISILKYNKSKTPSRQYFISIIEYFFKLI